VNKFYLLSNKKGLIGHFGPTTLWGRA